MQTPPRAPQCKRSRCCACACARLLARRASPRRRADRPALCAGARNGEAHNILMVVHTPTPQVPKRSKARMETGYSNAPFLGLALSRDRARARPTPSLPPHPPPRWRRVHGLGSGRRRRRRRISCSWVSAQLAMPILMRHARRHGAGDAIQQALREAAGKMPEGVVPHAVLVCVNSLYCNDGLVGETVTTKDGRWLPAPSPLSSVPCPVLDGRGTACGGPVCCASCPRASGRGA